MLKMFVFAPNYRMANNWFINEVDVKWKTKGYPKTTNNFPIFAVEHTKCNFLNQKWHF